MHMYIAFSHDTGITVNKSVITLYIYRIGIIRVLYVGYMFLFQCRCTKQLSQQRLGCLQYSHDILRQMNPHGFQFHDLNV